MSIPSRIFPSLSDIGGDSTTPKKCSWCDSPRARNDLCNRCRQKVESRARRMIEQKIRGDINLIHEISTFLQKHLNLSLFNAAQFNQLFVEIFPLLVCLIIMCIFYKNFFYKIDQ